MQYNKMGRSEALLWLWCLYF